MKKATATSHGKRRLAASDGVEEDGGAIGEPAVFIGSKRSEDFIAQGTWYRMVSGRTMDTLQTMWHVDAFKKKRALGNLICGQNHQIFTILFCNAGGDRRPRRILSARKEPRIYRLSTKNHDAKFNIL